MPRLLDTSGEQSEESAAATQLTDQAPRCGHISYHKLQKVPQLSPKIKHNAKMPVRKIKFPFNPVEDSTSTKTSSVYATSNGNIAAARSKTPKHKKRKCL